MDPFASFTPATFLQGMLAQMTLESASAEPAAIAGLLEEVAPTLADLGRRDLSDRLGVTAMALKSGDHQRTDWLRSKLFGELERMQRGLEEGQPLDQVLRGPAAGQALQQLVGTPGAPFTSPSARPARNPIGPPPVIRWSEFGSKEHPAPNPPSGDVVSAGKRLSYFFYYVAHHAGRVSEGDAEEFFGISERVRRRIRDGHFAPEAMGQFLSADATRLIRTAAQVEPKYGQLMGELAVQAFFESQEWSLGVPPPEAPWDVWFLYGLRRYFAKQILTEEGKARVTADRALVQVVCNQASLEQVLWHPGRTRHEVFDPWLEAMNANHKDLPGARKRTDDQRRYIGDGVLRSLGWRPPRAGSSEAIRIQWMVRYWIAHYHYGALPARGLPYPVNVIIRFAMAKRPGDLSHEFVENLLAMMSDFYTEDEIRTRTVRREAA